MAKSIFISLAIYFCALALAPLGSNAFGQDHPFILAVQTEYPALREKSVRPPFSEIKIRALYDADHLAYEPDKSLEQRCKTLQAIFSANALAYILDPQNNQLYTHRIIAAFDNLAEISKEVRPELERPDSKNTAWVYSVPPGSVFFQATLALDIVYPTLDDRIRKQLCEILAKMAHAFEHTDQIHQQNVLGVRIIWALFNHDLEKVKALKQRYFDTIRIGLTQQGIFFQGPGYAFSRFSSDRTAKTYTMDILAHLGLAKPYRDSKLITLTEWLYSGALTPTLRNVGFGDSDPTRLVEATWGEAAPFRATRFSKSAGNNAAWVTKDTLPKGRLLNYFLADSNPSNPVKPQSAIWPSCMASLRERDPNPPEHSLMGALWSCQGAAAHSHKEVNAIFLAGLGETLLTNSGYSGYGQGFGQFSFDYVNNTAIAGNTLVIDGQDHALKSGGGVDGFLNPKLDLTTGFSGLTLPNGEHWRNLILVQPTPDTLGYFILFDLVRPEPNSKLIQLALHPNSPVTFLVKKNFLYKSLVEQQNDYPTSLLVALGTRPNSVTINPGAICAFDSKSIIAKFLLASYSVEHGPSTQIVTGLIPINHNLASAPQLSRVSTRQVQGLKLDYRNGTVDYALGSRLAEIDYAGIKHDGSSSVLRTTGGKPSLVLTIGALKLEFGGLKIRSNLSNDIYVDSDSIRLKGDSRKISVLLPSGSNLSFNGKKLKSTTNEYIHLSVAHGVTELKFGR